MPSLKNKLKHYSFILVLLIYPVIWLFVSSFFQTSDASFQYNTIFLFLTFGISLFAIGLVFALKFWVKPLNLWTILFSAYGLPLLAIFLVTLWVKITQTQNGLVLLEANLFRSTWQPLYYVWQSMFLFSALFILFKNNPAAGQSLLPGGVIRGILAGFGFGLCGAFFSSIVIKSVQGFNLSPPPAMLLWVLFIFSITVTPYAVQRFYRTILEPQWAVRFPKVSAAGLTAVFFAVVQVGWLNFPLAIMGGLFFSAIYRRQQLWPAVITHALVNLILFLTHWFLVF